MKLSAVLFKMMPYIKQINSAKQTRSMRETAFQSSDSKNKGNNLCFGCGEPHFRRDCPFLKTVCNSYNSLII